MAGPLLVKFGRKLIERGALAAYQARTQPGGVKSRGRPYKTGEAAPAPAVENRGGATGPSVVTRGSDAAAQARRK